MWSYQTETVYSIAYHRIWGNYQLHSHFNRQGDATDDGRVAFLPGETFCPGTVHGVRGGDGTMVAVSPSTDTAREVNGQETELGNHAPRQGAIHIQDDVFNCRATKELPC